MTNNTYISGSTPITVAILLSLLVGFFPVRSSANSDLEVSGWIPYWRNEQGIAATRKNIDVLDIIHPFGYSVKLDGSLSDLSDLGSRDWSRLERTAKSNRVDIIPTVMWSDGKNIHHILSDDRLRERHIDEIVSMVKGGRYAGVDIDYEAKWAETKDYYSLFLKELKKELGSKILSCTTESRTPPESLYRELPATIQYANDFDEIGTHCDRVVIMAYDQGRADYKLNDAKKGLPYAPVADVDWVEKVMRLAIESIPKDKLVIGIPTYGYEYEITVSPEWFQGYRRLWSFNPGYSEQISDLHNVRPSTNKAGEMSMSYFATSSPMSYLKYLPVPAGTLPGDVAAIQALTFANSTGLSAAFNYMTWSDASAVESKVELARKLGLRGVAIFKIDGGEDPRIWDVLRK